MIAPTITTVATARTSGDRRPSSVMRGRRLARSPEVLHGRSQSLEQGHGAVALGRLQRGEDLAPADVDAAALLAGRLEAGGGQLDVHAAAVVLRARAPDEAGALERVEHARRRGRG